MLEVVVGISSGGLGDPGERQGDRREGDQRENAVSWAEPPGIPQAGASVPQLSGHTT